MISISISNEISIQFNSPHHTPTQHNSDLLCNSLCRKPSEIVGISRAKGSIRPGADADFVLFDPDAPRQLPTRKAMRHYALDPFIKNDALTTVNDGAAFVQQMLEEKNAQRFSPHYHLRGKVKTTYLRGRKIFDDGEVVGAPHGQVFRRGYSGAVAKEVVSDGLSSGKEDVVAVRGASTVAEAFV